MKTLLVLFLGVFTFALSGCSGSASSKLLTEAATRKLKDKEIMEIKNVDVVKVDKKKESLMGYTLEREKYKVNVEVSVKKECYPYANNGKPYGFFPTCKTPEDIKQIEQELADAKKSKSMFRAIGSVDLENQIKNLDRTKTLKPGETFVVETEFECTRDSSGSNKWGCK